MGVLQRMSPLFRRKSSRNNNTVTAIEAEVDYIVQRSPFLKMKAVEGMETGEVRRSTRPQHHDDDIINNNEDCQTTTSIPPPPTFNRKEYQIGALLGSGSFSTVHAISGFKLSSPNSSSHSSNTKRRRRRGSSIRGTNGRPLLQKVSSVSSCLTSDTSTFFTTAAASASTPLTPTSTDLRSEDPNNNNKVNDSAAAAAEDHNEVARFQLSQSVLDSKTGESRYAVKVVKKELLKNHKKRGGSSSSYSPNAFRNAAADLIVEAMYLAAFDHPNILKLRGIAKGGCFSFLDGKHDGFFMIVDRLQETLDDRIQQWKIATNNNNNNSLQFQQQRLTQQVDYALQMADALSYLHDRRILFRDLKPSNVGFKKDTPHTVQLFDFGLARELPPTAAASSSSGSSRSFFEDHGSAATDDDNNSNEAFQMSGAGTFVYMSPENINSRTYNLKADVYSWSMVTMEMIALRRPFEEFTPEEHKEFVCEIGQRPSLSDDTTMPKSLQNVLKLAWEQDPVQRYTMRQVVGKLRPILQELESSLRCYDDRDNDDGIPQPIPPPRLLSGLTP